MSRLNRFATDARYAWRTVRRAPAFAVPVCFTVALAVGMAVAASAVVNVSSLSPATFSTPLRLDSIRDPGWTTDWGSNLLASADWQNAALDGGLLVLALIAATILVIAAVTLINLQLQRASERGLEQAVQSALGASRHRRMVRLAAEGIWLAAIGAGLGLLLGFVAGAALRLSWPHEVAAEPDFPGLWTVALGVGLPLLAMILLPVASGLASDGRAAFPRLLRTGDRATGGPGSALLRDGFAVAQLAASVALLVGAGLLLRVPPGTTAGESARPGVRDTLVVRLDLDAKAFTDPAERTGYYRRLVAEVSRIPGLADTTLSSPGALMAAGPPGRAQSACGNCFRGGVYVPLLPAIVRYHAVGPDFFRRRGIPVLEGREFGDEDGPDSPRVAVVSAGFAASHFEDGRALGKELRLGGANGAWCRIVGVVPDIRAAGLDSGQDRVPALYLPLFQAPTLSVDLAVRTGSAAGDLRSTLEKVVVAGEPDVRFGGLGTLREEWARRIAPLRWLGLVLALGGCGALLLAVQGLAAVMRFHVRRRRRELAVRLSLGATPGRVVSLVLRRPLVIAIVGVLVGVWASLPLVGWSEGLVAPDASLDPWIGAFIVAGLAGAALLGAAIPAWSAARLDPSVCLREE